MHWHHIRLGLQENTSPSINNKLRDKSAHTIQTQTTEKQHQPYPIAPIKYVSKKQYATQQSTAPLIDIKGKKFIQQVCKKFLFLGRAVNSTLLCPIRAILL